MTDSCLTNPYTGESVGSIDEIDTYAEANADQTDGDDVTTVDGYCMRYTQQNDDGELVTTHMCDVPRKDGVPTKECQSNAECTVTKADLYERSTMDLKNLDPFNQTDPDVRKNLCDRLQSDLCHTYATLESDEPGRLEVDLHDVEGCQNLGKHAHASEGGAKCGRVAMYDSGSCAGSCLFPFDYLSCADAYGFDKDASGFEIFDMSGAAEE